MKFNAIAAVTAIWAAVAQASPAPIAQADRAPVAVSAPELISRQVDGFICGPANTDNFGRIVSPKPGTNITQIRGSYDGVDIEVIYCSTQYFKTRSLGLTVGLAFPGAPGGELLALNYGPSDEAGVAPVGFYGYKFVVTLYPISGNLREGERTLGVFETTTGYYNPNNYNTQEVNINFVIVNP